MTRTRIAVVFLTASLLFSVASGAIFAGGAGERDEEAVQHIVMGSGSPGGSYYAVGVALSTFLTEAIPEISVSVESTGGSLDNANLLEREEIDIGLVQSSELYSAAHGIGRFEDREFENLRQMTYLYPAIVHLIATERSGIERVSDLAGKRMGIGPPGSGSAVAFELLLEELGIHSEVTLDRLSPSAGVSNMGDGHISAFSFAGIPPTGFVQEAEASVRRIRLIDMGPEAHDSGYFEKYPYYWPMEIPAEAYASLSEPVEAIGTPHFLATRAGLSDDIVYKILEKIFSEEGQRTLKEAVANIQIDESLGGREEYLPWHPGAARYWRERGQM